MGEILKVETLTKRFGGLLANDRISLTVSEGEVVGLIGPNGAGKTTLFNCIAGYHSVNQGNVFFKGKNITNLAPERVCREGIARTFQLVKVFNEMTVLENVMIGAFLWTRNRRRVEDKALEILEFIGLYDKRMLWAETLTLPDKKMVEFARALASEPKLLLLDEVLAGLSGVEVKKAVELIAKVAKKGMALLVVEHVMEVIMPISDKVVVLDHGTKIAEDKPEEVINDLRVIEAYLGKKYVAKRRRD